MTIQELLRVYGEEYNEALIFTTMFLFLRDSSIDRSEFSGILSLVNTALSLVTFPAAPFETVTISENISITKV